MERFPLIFLSSPSAGDPLRSVALDPLGRNSTGIYLFSSSVVSFRPPRWFFKNFPATAPIFASGFFLGDRRPSSLDPFFRSEGAGASFLPVESPLSASQTDALRVRRQYA